MLTRDPSSTLLENVTSYEQTKVVCGEFNSKNAFGAYVGQLAFVYNDGDVKLESDAGFVDADAKCGLAGEASRKRTQNISARFSRHLDGVIDDLKEHDAP